MTMIEGRCGYIHIQCEKCKERKKERSSISETLLVCGFVGVHLLAFAFPPCRAGGSFFHFLSQNCPDFRPFS